MAKLLVQYNKPADAAAFDAYYFSKLEVEDAVHGA